MFQRAGDAQTITNRSVKGSASTVRLNPGKSRTQSVLIRTGSHFLLTEHDTHQRRRKPLEPFFSRSGILRLHSLLAGNTENSANRIEEMKGTGLIIRLDHAFLPFRVTLLASCAGRKKSSAWMTQISLQNGISNFSGAFELRLIDFAKVRSRPRHYLINILLPSISSGSTGNQISPGKLTTSQNTAEA